MKRLMNIFKPKGAVANKSYKRTGSAAPSSNLLTSMMNDLPVRQEWLDQDEIDRIRRDAIVISSVGSRKAATLKKELFIDCKDEALKAAIIATFGQKTLRKILDAPMQGCAVFELNWKEDDATSLWRPVLVERDYRGFDVVGGELKFFRYGMPEDVPPYKAAWTTYEDKFHRPMGTPLAEALFWPVKFKNASLEFWVKFLEKYGVPWAVGKTEGDKDEMADELYAMLSGDSAVIDTEDEIEIHMAQRVGDFDKITEYCDNQIRQIILGGNLTGEVKGGSYAAANVHNEIREDIAMADENLTLEIVHEVAAMIRELNRIGSEITISLKDKDDPNTQLAERDERIANMGYRPKKSYLERTYNIELEEYEAPGQIANAPKPQRVFAFSAEKPADALEGMVDALSLKKIELSFQNQIVKILEESQSFEEAIDALQEAYPKTELSDLQELMATAMANAEILARAEVEEETEE